MTVFYLFSCSSGIGVPFLLDAVVPCFFEALEGFDFPWWMLGAWSVVVLWLSRLSWARLAGVWFLVPGVFWSLPVWIDGFGFLVCWAFLCPWVDSLWVFSVFCFFFIHLTFSCLFSCLVSFLVSVGVLYPFLRLFFFNET